MFFINTEMLSLLGELALGCVIIMALIFVACIVTPKLAARIAKKHPDWEMTRPERVEDAAKGRIPEDQEPHSAFESSTIEGFDPNYKIYHQDIYGVDFKHGKKQKNG